MEEFVRQFGIDWKLLLAQAVNFGLLFFLLERFAYRPVLTILAERKRRIEEGVRMRKEAEEKLAGAARERDLLLRTAGEESLAIVTRAEELGKVQAERIVADGSKKAEEAIQEGKRRAEEEKRIAADAFAIEARELIRYAVAKVILVSPEKVDDALLQRALKEAKRAS